MSSGLTGLSWIEGALQGVSAKAGPIERALSSAKYISRNQSFLYHEQQPFKVIPLPIKAGRFNYHFGTLFYPPAGSEGWRSPKSLESTTASSGTCTSQLFPRESRQPRDFRAPGSAWPSENFLCFSPSRDPTLFPPGF